MDGGGDGLTFVWSSTQTPTLGGSGGNVGVCDSTANGLAVLLWSLNDKVQLLDVMNNACNQEGQADASVYGTRDVEISARAASVDVVHGGAILKFASPRNVTVRAIGFTAGTGGARARHVVDDVRVEICKD